MLKAKQVTYFLAHLKDQKGLVASSDDENKVWIHNHLRTFFRNKMKSEKRKSRTLKGLNK